MNAVNLLPPGLLVDALREDVRAGLGTAPKSLPSKWHYDVQGRVLFEKIAELPAYYPTRAEHAVLWAVAGQIAELAAGSTLVELGPATVRRTAILLDALREPGALAGYVGVDLSERAVGETARALANKYPGLAIRPIVADYEEHLGLPGYPVSGKTLVVSLGSTFGSMMPARRARYLAGVRARLSAGDALLLGTGLVKERSVLVAAYDDGVGLTAALNKNILAVLNARLGADFDLNAFEHVVTWVPEAARIELRLRSIARQHVRIPGAGLTVPFTAGEELRTEVVGRFRRASLAAELAAAGFALRGWWTDPDESFALSLSVPQ